MLIITPIVIVGTMLLIYRSVSKVEHRMRNNGVSALHLNARSRGGNRGENVETNNTRPSASNDQGIMSRIKRSVLMCVIPPCLHRRDDQAPTSRSNRATSQKRAILHMAAGYALAWAFVCIPFILIVFLHESHVTLILHSCLNPLQGLFDFLVFMSPKVRNAKRSRREGVIKAYMSRGERRRTERNLSSRNTRTAVRRVSAWNQRVQRSLKSLLSRTRITRDTRSYESNAWTTKNDQSSTNPNQVSAPAEKKT